MDELTDKIKDKLANRTDKTVFLKADQRAHFGWVVEVVDNVRAAGVDQLGLLTDQKKSGALAPPTGATVADGRAVAGKRSHHPRRSLWVWQSAPKGARTRT